MGDAAMTDRAASEALLSRYIAACESRDPAGIVACFAPRATVIDPTSPAIRGRRQIGAYFRGLYDDLASLRLTVSPLYWQGGEVACRWQGTAQRRGGGVIAYEGIDVFRLSQAPLITRMQAFWDPKDFTPG
jgi:ketosteroid isomerase-like protein